MLLATTLLFFIAGRASFYGIAAKDFSVLLLFILSLMALFKAFVRPNHFRFYWVDIIPGLILISWIYSVFSGILHGNNLAYVFKNNAACSWYLIYYCFVFFSLTSKDALALAKTSALVVAASTLLLIAILKSGAFTYSNFMVNLIYPGVSGGSSKGVFRAFFLPQVSFFFFIGFAIDKLMKADNFATCIAGLFYFIFAVFFTLYCTGSKGFALGVFVFIFCFIVLLLTRWIVTGAHLRNGESLFLLLCLCGLILLFATPYYQLIFDAFETKDISNKTRYEQLYVLMDNLSLLGKGSGAVIESYIRNDDLPYGYELAYLNLFHKFGIIVGLIPISAYFYSFFGSLRSVFKIGPNVKNLIALTAHGFLFVALGNNILFSSYCVFIHCISLFLLRQEFVERQVLSRSNQTAGGLV